MSDPDDLAAAATVLNRLHDAGMTAELMAKLAEYPALAQRVVAAIETYDPTPTWSKPMIVELDKEVQGVLPGLRVYLSRRMGIVLGFYVSSPGFRGWSPRRSLTMAYCMGWVDLCEGVQVQKFFDNWTLKFAFRVRSDSPHALPV